MNYYIGEQQFISSVFIIAMLFQLLYGCVSCQAYMMYTEVQNSQSNHKEWDLLYVIPSDPQTGEYIRLQAPLQQAPS